MVKKLDNSISFIYIDSKGNTTERTVINFSQNDDYLEGYCTLREETKTFRKDRIQKILDSVYTNLPEENQLICNFFNKRRDGSPIGKVETNEICFTGFSSKRKKELIDLAKDNGFVIRASATTYLDFLICGSNAGLSKIQKAKSSGAIIMTEDEFIKILDTGELPEVA